MSGHSHWSGIKRKKNANDQKRSLVFSKLLTAISLAAREEANPQFNPRLRSMIEKAKECKVPQENIDRAVNKASGIKNLDGILVEAYGPEGTALLIEAITDNKNRTIPEIKKILGDHGAKFAEKGSVLWAFEKTDLPPDSGNDGWQPKFPQNISREAEEKIETLMEDLSDHPDVQEVYSNAAF